MPGDSIVHTNDRSSNWLSSTAKPLLPLVNKKKCVWKYTKTICSIKLLIHLQKTVWFRWLLQLQFTAVILLESQDKPRFTFKKDFFNHKPTFSQSSRNQEVLTVSKIHKKGSCNDSYPQLLHIVNQSLFIFLLFKINYFRHYTLCWVTVTKLFNAAVWVFPTLNESWQVWRLSLFWPP